MADLPMPVEGVPIPSMGDLKKLPPEQLVEKIVQANRALQRRDGEWSLKLQQECNRLRTATAQHVKELEETNSTLLRSLTRLQMENDKLKSQITTLEVKLEAACMNGNGQRRFEEPSPIPVLPMSPRTLAQAPDLSPVPGPTPLAFAPSVPILTGETIPENKRAQAQAQAQPQPPAPPIPQNH